MCIETSFMIRSLKIEIFWKMKFLCENICRVMMLKPMAFRFLFFFYYYKREKFGTLTFCAFVLSRGIAACCSVRMKQIIILYLTCNNFVTLNPLQQGLMKNKNKEI